MLTDEEFDLINTTYPIVFSDSFINKEGKTIYVYLLDTADTSWYEESKGDYFRRDTATGKAVYYSTKNLGKQSILKWFHYRGMSVCDGYFIAENFSKD